jgi:pimeloyl-ACP methyl ester carboxylesterase
MPQKKKFRLTFVIIGFFRIKIHFSDQHVGCMTMRIKNAIKLSLIIIACVGVLAIIILVGLALIPPDPFKPKLPNLIGESVYQLDEKVGWYLENKNVFWLVTWGAENGLTMNRFDPNMQRHLKPQTEDVLSLKIGKSDFKAEFKRDTDLRIIGMQWFDEQGQHNAKRLDNYAYDQKEAHFKSLDIGLAGLLMTPVSHGPYPAVMMIHGSGVSDRDNFWYLYQADYLAKKGIAVLLPDKRGCGKSGGEWHIAGMEDFAEDADSGLDYLQHVEGVDSTRTGLLGFSQGGMIAPLAASKSSKARFVINVSGSATTFNRQISHEIANDFRRGGAPSFIIPIIKPVFIMRAKKRRPIWWKKNGDYDPVKYWRQLTIPALVVFGREDEFDNVPVSLSLDRLMAAKRNHQEMILDIKVYDNSGHALGDPSTGWIRKDYLDMLAEWILNIPRSH